ncbi:MAG: hypothetical protein QOE49_830, partial [Rhodospirillaceae bacterium]|nr:hypothetical protein [Rhodospirillaceae bacterium]
TLGSCGWQGCRPTTSMPKRNTSRTRMTAEAIVFAVTQGWALVEAGRSICLIDAGRRLVASR